MNNSITITSIEERKEWIIEVDENLEPHPECCIYRVPDVLRKVNEDAYTPKVISIGPLHHGIDKFAGMEKQKIRYKREFGKRITIEKWQELINFIEENEQRIRNYYAEKSKLEKHEFVTMILYDAVFIIELFLRSAYKHKSDFLLYIRAKLVEILSDLELLENQLPFFVLNGLYELAFPSRSDSFLSLSIWFFRLCKVDEITFEVEGEVKHFTDLRRYFMTKNFPKSQSPDYFTNMPCAVKLEESGVKFNCIEGECLLDMRFVKKKLCFSFLKVYEFQIPHIALYDNREVKIRNVMALEQCCYPRDTLVCNYFLLMNMLIHTEEDVNLLVAAGIIFRGMGDSARIAKLFNTLCDNISTSPSHYAGIFYRVKAQYENPRNHAKAILKRVYFNNPWKGTATVAAIVLLLLTLIQTICSIKSVV